MGRISRLDADSLGSVDRLWARSRIAVLCPMSAKRLKILIAYTIFNTSILKMTLKIEMLLRHNDLCFSASLPSDMGAASPLLPLPYHRRNVLDV